MPHTNIVWVPTYACLILFILSANNAYSAEASDILEQEVINESTGIAGWIIKDDTFFLELNQRAPQPMRGFFEGRGFNSKIADQLARHCTFQVHIRNIAETSSNNEIISDMADWRVIHNNQSQPPILKQEWLSRWQSASEEISTAARIAFRWATFPSPQAFSAGDFNWGLATFGPAPGEPFDLEIHWTLNGNKQHYRINNMSCPIDPAVE
ncbi:MAG: hypothetical protein GXP22_07515 [Gammaproteobacteria bacterium]|nr:hypothetical protein [Gammaproteobacteria bacterium]